MTQRHRTHRLRTTVWEAEGDYSVSLQTFLWLPAALGRHNPPIPVSLLVFTASEPSFFHCCILVFLIRVYVAQAGLKFVALESEACATVPLLPGSPHKDTRH